jgi:chromosome partitioning protein
MRTIAIVNQKGGSGKTTTSVNLAAALVEAGKKVLLIDLDPQASASLWYGFKEKGKGLYAVLTEDVELHHAIEKTSIDGLSVIPSSGLLAGVEKALANEVASESILKNKFHKLSEKPWDFLLLDCPPTLGILSLNALTIANEVLIPVEAHVMALHGLVQLLKTINLVKQRLNPSLEITGILACRVDYRTKHSQEVLSQLRTRFEGKVCQAVIRENIRLAEAPLHLKPINLYDPSCNGTHDYRKLAQEILGQSELPAPDAPAAEAIQ